MSEGENGWPGQIDEDIKKIGFDIGCGCAICHRDRGGGVALFRYEKDKDKVGNFG